MFTGKRPLTTSDRAANTYPDPGGLNLKCERVNESAPTKEGFAMSVIAWIVLGLVAGFIAAKIVNKTGAGFFLDIVLGIVGAVVGGFIFSAVGASGVTGFNLYSLVVSVIGAIVVLVIITRSPEGGRIDPSRRQGATSRSTPRTADPILIPCCRLKSDPATWASVATVSGRRLPVCPCRRSWRRRRLLARRS